MARSFELTRLDSNTFEHMVNMLATEVLGKGHTGFGPGADGGRDGYFEGRCSYPSAEEAWSGVWYIQSKFHAPGVSGNPQKWLLNRIQEELDAFSDPASNREWPDNWILATNVDPSAAAKHGTFDKAKELIRAVRPQLVDKFHIWGGEKILTLLSLHKSVLHHYSQFLTSGHLISELYRQLSGSSAGVQEILRHWIVSDFVQQQYTKLEQAGSTADNRPGIQELFSDLPFHSIGRQRQAHVAIALAKTLAERHVVRADIPDGEAWRRWQHEPERSRMWFIKGGPGQGKSTVTQYIAQIQRAAYILESEGFVVTPAQRVLAENVKKFATAGNLWPIAPRVPVYVELKNYAQWIGETSGSKRMLPYLCFLLENELGQPVRAGTLKTAFSAGRWLFIFDGLDEVPGDIKDLVANEVIHFVDDVLIGCGCDAAAIATSRPQGYSGQFDNLDAATVTLAKLQPGEALSCAEPLLKIGRSTSESRDYISILEDALHSESIKEIMTTPLQSHIMAVVVRDGGRPPERKWQLFDTFYKVIKKREANRNLPNRKLAALLRAGDVLIKTLHNRLGFELHSRAETKSGAVTSLKRDEFRSIVRQVVSSLQEADIEETVEVLMEAATERLVLVNTPESGEAVRFDIRPLQEFFAAEHIYDSANSDGFSERMRTISGDSHWSEVVHFILSALVENNRKTELSVAVSLLIELDEGDAVADRLFYRKLAKGGIIAARLLREGVLEHDKRIRSLFGKCIDSLISANDSEDFLAAVASPHSKSWVID
ncbi:NACHT domain-containing protein [Neorhizobium alkalisoli]|uniref:NACHT domain-containing protein n=1 Tax=Neorhizobium alkalisoli TaxID=528178 RepID=UPI00131A21AF|nr:hypothetical protein [Neorhizobium alkalisoli]